MTFDDEWYDCEFCDGAYGTNSLTKLAKHERECSKGPFVNRDTVWADIPPEYREFFYDSTKEH